MMFKSMMWSTSKKINDHCDLKDLGGWIANKTNCFGDLNEGYMSIIMLLTRMVEMRRPDAPLVDPFLFYSVKLIWNLFICGCFHLSCITLTLRCLILKLSFKSFEFYNFNGSYGLSINSLWKSDI